MLLHRKCSLEFLEIRNYVYAIRSHLSQKVQSELFSENLSSTQTTINNNETDKQSTGLEKKPIKKFDSSLIPKEAHDNFVITFNKKIPTYDQLYEYQIDKKLYNRTRFINEAKWLSVDAKVKRVKKYDLSLDELKRYLIDLVDRNEHKHQKYLIRRHGILGPDLAAAHFILSRGGRVRFKHQADNWTIDIKAIPPTYEKIYRLLSIDGSGLNLIYEGLDNIILLKELEELNLSGNPRLDDWACDKLARIFRNSKCLYYLNLSDLPLLTHRGVEALHKIPSLKTLVIRNTKASQYQFIELLILLFNEINPNCKIIYD